MVEEDYIEWARFKYRLQRGDRPQVYFREREVWWTSIGLNIGDEEYGKGLRYSRPVLVIRRINRNIFYGVPLSSAAKSGSPYYSINVNNRNSVILLSQLRVFDARRLTDKLDFVDAATFLQIKKVLAERVFGTKL